MNTEVSPGEDLDPLPAPLTDIVIGPADPRYPEVSSSQMRGGRPALVLQPRDAHEVARAVTYAGAQPVPLAVRSGGHGFSGRSTNDGGIVIDLSALRAIEVLDTETRRVRVGPGARWGAVAAALQPHGWALTSGDHGAVGVGGLATAGGIGLLGREHGLTIDQLTAVEIVLADGSTVRADASHHTDLFWAVRGAGFALGIVTAFEFTARPVGLLGHAHLVQDAARTAAYIESWAAAAQAAPRDTTSFLTIGAPYAGRVFAQSSTVVDSDDPLTVRARVRPFADIAPVIVEQVSLARYADIITAPGELHAAEGEPVSRSGLLDDLTPAVAQTAARLITSGETYFFQLRAMGGAIADVAPADTAFAHRSAAFQMVAMGVDAARLDQYWAPLRRHLSGLYVSFETDTHADRLREAFPPGTLHRLATVKRRYDPQNVFHDNFDLSPVL
ncbi:FAD-binding oxidoreductase [Streptomyces sp. NPDC005498]|uniref:FAD-binding oxidoreductase n=1 Tax=Streptomyces sp. NPDC005498 TaxID=3364717 RepID=UPI0036C53D8D